MKFKPSRRKKDSLIVEIKPDDAGVIAKIAGPITDLKKVLVPIDFSECSKHALRYAVAFAKQFSARIVLLAVIEDNRTAFEYGNPEYVENLKERTARYEAELNALAKQYLGKIRNERIVATGRPFEVIVQTAKELDIDLIVIATHGYASSRAELGSTTERVIRYAGCPVLVVREKERDFVPRED